MRKIIWLCLLLLPFATLHAAGGITHMFIAHEAIKSIQDRSLRNLLKNNLEAYLVGAYYPDSGYVNHTHYGEDSHSQSFINTFADYIKETYPNPEIANPKLLAFLYGCATHHVSDKLFHRVFYKKSAEKDFAGDTNRAHQNGDLGIDILVTIDKNQWFTNPKEWWIPVKDLMQVYHRMNHDEYNEAEITHGTSVIYFAGFGERLIAAPAYAYFRLKMPWTAQHYYQYPFGGVTDNVQQVANYLDKLWDNMHAQPGQTLLEHEQPLQESAQAKKSKLFALSEQAIDHQWVRIPQEKQADGSVIYKSPVVSMWLKFQLALKQYLLNLMAS